MKKLKISTMVFYYSAMAGVPVFLTPAQALNIPVPNGDFELPQSGYGFDAGKGWRSLDGDQLNDDGVEQHTTAQFNTGGGWDGTRTAFTQGDLTKGFESENSLALLVPDSLYTVTLQVGGRADATFDFDSIKVELLANGTPLAISRIFNPRSKAGDLATWSFRCDTTGLIAGAELKIRIRSKFRQIIYDNVTLAVTPKSPTPPTNGAIDILNGNFNLPQASYAGWSAGTGWTRVSIADGAPSEDAASSGVELHSFSKFAEEGGWDVTQTAYVQGGLISSDPLDPLLANSTYQLKLQVGERLDYGSGLSSVIVELRAGNTVLTPTAIVRPAAPGPRSGTLANWAYTYDTTGIAPALIGLPLRIRLGNNNPQPILDNVELSVAPVTVSEKFTQILEATPGNVSLTWTSRPGRTYTLKTSQTLASWPTIVNANIPTGGATTSFTHTLPLPRPGKLFYQIYENPAAP
jgi:hypothetical protein